MKKLIFLLLIGIIIYMCIPYSPLKQSFRKKVRPLISSITPTEEIFTIEDFELLPEPLKNYFIYCGFLGSKKISMVHMIFEDVNFSLGIDKPSVSMNYDLYDFSDSTSRLAFIDSRIFGLPFQGSEGFLNGSGWMKGVVAKHITLFNETGSHMDRGSLVTYLGESIVHPSLALNDSITFFPDTENSVKAIIKSGTLEESGVFYFSKDFSKVTFKALRYNSDSKSYENWIAEIGDHKILNGIKVPNTFKGIWDMDGNPFTYFHSKKITVEWK